MHTRVRGIFFGDRLNQGWRNKSPTVYFSTRQQWPVRHADHLGWNFVGGQLLFTMQGQHQLPACCKGRLADGGTNKRHQSWRRIIQAHDGTLHKWMCAQDMLDTVQLHTEPAQLDLQAKGARWVGHCTIKTKHTYLCILRQAAKYFKLTIGSAVPAVTCSRIPHTHPCKETRGHERRRGVKVARGQAFSCDENFVRTAFIIMG